MFEPSSISVFIAGVLMFLAPCTLPLVPAYLAFISGVSAHGERLGKKDRVAIAQNGLAFVIGFSFVFICFGILLGLFGMYLAPYRSVLARLGGALIIFFGLVMLGVVRLPSLSRDRRFSLGSLVTPGKSSSSFLVGASFAFGWTPCVGPILASVLLLASTSGSIVAGGTLLGVFALGLAIPFLLCALLFGAAQHALTQMGRVTRFIPYVGGVLLVVLGLLLATESFGLTATYGYQLFEFLNYDALLDYL